MPEHYARWPIHSWRKLLMIGKAERQLVLAGPCVELWPMLLESSLKPKQSASP